MKFVVTSCAHVVRSDIASQRSFKEIYLEILLNVLHFLYLKLFNLLAVNDFGIIRKLIIHRIGC